MRPGELWRRLRFWRRREDLTRELSDELQAHYELLVRDYESTGQSREAAQAAARRQLGNLGQIRESSRDQWGFPTLDAVLRDLRHTLRSLRKSPGFAVTVILTLGLGIGANAVMFGIVDRLMFRPYPYLRDPGTVHRVYLRSTDRGREQISSSTEYTRYLDLRRWTSSFEAYAPFTERRLAIGVGDATRERRVGMVSAEFFDFFEMRPALGRFFLPAEDVTPKGAPVAVLGHAFWQTEFGGRNVLGESLQVGHILCTIVGVAPPGFTGLNENAAPALYIPITTYAGNQLSVRQATTYFTTYNWGWMEFMVRRKPGVSVEQAAADLSAAYVRSWNKERESGSLAPVEVAKPQALAGPLKTGAGPDAGLEAPTALWVSGVAVIVLLIACANVANLFLARALRRRRETAVRLALGVSRARLVGQCLVESGVLVGLGTLVGLLVAQWGGKTVRSLFLTASPLDVLTDWRTLGVAAAAAAFAGLLTGLVPAFVALRGDVTSSLKAGAREGTHARSRLRGGLLIAQGALSVALLVGAGLFVRSLDRVKALRLGFDPEPVLLAEPKLRGLNLSEAENIALGRRVLETAQALPGVAKAAWVGSVPFYSTSGTLLHVPGIDSVMKLGRFSYQAATGDYFATMGTRVVRGRPFTSADRAGTARVVLVSESMARLLWPDRDALGQCIKVGADTMPCTTVIGVAEDAFQRSITDDQRLHYYLPLEQGRETDAFALLVRVRGDAEAQVEPLRRELQKLMPGQAYVTVRPLTQLVDPQRRSWRFGATMFVAFGGLALLVAAVGLYGVIAYSVAQRMHELGVRVALGARSRDVIRLVLGQAMRYTVIGLAIGSGIAWIAARRLEPLLFQQSARDPGIYLGVTALLLAVSLVASASPARRASRADPNSALRSE